MWQGRCAASCEIVGLSSRLARIMLGEEDMPLKKLESNNKYSYKVTARAISFVNKDKTRTNAI